MAATGTQSPRELGLRWKAFLLLMPLILVANGALEYFRYQSIRDANAQQAGRRFERHVRTFRAEMQRFRQDVAEVAMEAASEYKYDDLLRTDATALLEALHAPVEWAEAYSGSTRSAIWSLSGAAPSSGAAVAGLIRETQQALSPAALLYCESTCVYIVAVPVLDREGESFTLVLAVPITELLFNYGSASNSDLVLLVAAAAPARQVPGDSRLWNYSVRGITNAGVLAPRLKAVAAQQPFPAPDEVVEATVGDTHLRMVLRTVPGNTYPSPILALHVVDDTESVIAINALTRRHVMEAFGLTIVFFLLLFVLLSFATRRLIRVMRALPLLAEKRFAEAQALMSTSRASPFPDEIDRLRSTAQELTVKLERLDTVEAESSAKSRFLATVSHEIRTPMNAILGLTEILARSNLDEEQRQQAALIHTSAEALLTIINDILDFSKLEAGRYELECAPLSLRALVEGVLGTFAGSARSKGVRITEFVDPALPARVLGDVTRLRQILLNLVSNGLKFTERGRIWLRVTAANGNTGRLRFQVRDTGIGITAEQQSRLFQPFVQAEDSTTRRFGGTGLGLSICRALVTRMGGEIGVQSQPGLGSEFWFEIDLPATERDGDPDWPESDWLKGLCIALSIRDPDERSGIASYLRRVGAEIVVGTEGQPQPLVVVDDAPGGVLLRIRNPASGREQVLPQPVFLRQLLNHVAALGGFERRTFPREAHALIRPGQVTDAMETQTGLRCHVLVAEDNPTNRTVIETQLKRLSCDARILEDARKVVPLLHPGHRYDILLTDLHMPDMDGYELARAVRAHEAANNLRRLPIIAFTADAAPEVVARCRMMGMDDVMTKPLGLKALEERLRRWAPMVPAEPEPVDTNVLSELLGGADKDTLQTIIGDFVRMAPAQIDALESALARRDSKEVREIVHKMLGSSRSAGAKPLTEALLRLQAAARDDSFDAFAGLGAECKREFSRVRAWYEARVPLAAP